MLARYTYITLLTTLTLLGTIDAQAQTTKSVWNKPKETSKDLAKKLNKKKGKVKQWKEHVTEWGLKDSYTKQVSIGARANSNGWTGSIYYATKTKPGKHTVWQLSFSEIKHEKQTKQQQTKNAFPELGNSTPFVFGKINNLYTIQLGYHKEQLLLPSVIEDNLSVSFRYGSGFSLAMLKPYYLRLIYVDYTPPTTAILKSETYSEQNADIFLKEGNILGADKWSKGLDEMEYIPGAFGEISFVIVPANTKAFIQTITLGVNAAYYTKRLPIMAAVSSYQFQTSLFAGLALGKRW